MGRFQEYMGMFAANLEELNNQAIQRAVSYGFRALMDSTKMDSGQAAYYWQVITEGSGVGRTASGPLTFTDRRGQPPIGNRGDHGANRKALTQLRRSEIDSFIKKRVSGRNPDTKFYFKNPIFDASVDDYVENAELAQALKDAADVTIEYYNRLMLRWINSNGESWGIRKSVVKLNDV